MIYTANVIAADTPNKNNRVYSMELLYEIVRQFKTLPPRTVMGQMGMSNDAKIHLADVSHLVTDLRVVENRLVADIELLGTRGGRFLKMLLASDGVRFRLQGIGSNKVHEDGSIHIDIESYKFISVNALPPEIAS